MVNLSKNTEIRSDIGLLIDCTKCDENSKIFHLHFSALTCQYCKADVNLEDWKISSLNELEYRGDTYGTD